MQYLRTRKQIIMYKRLVNYCKQLNVTPIPLTAWSRKELQEKRPNERKVSRHTLGECYYSQPLIYIAYNKHSGIRQLDHTLRHELIHYRFTGIPHGVNFEKKAKELKQGKIFKSFDRTKWLEAFNLKWQLLKMESAFRHLTKV